MFLCSNFETNSNVKSKMGIIVGYGLEKVILKTEKYSQKKNNFHQILESSVKINYKVFQKEASG